MNMDLLIKKFGLSGLRGIVTGGSAGIGKQITLTLAEAGAEVFTFSRSGKFKENDNNSLNIRHIKIDITNTETCTSAIKEIGNNGLDFVINNAGVTIKKKFENLSVEEWEKIRNVNIDAVVNICKTAYPFLKKSALPGRIINIGSMAAHLGFSMVVPYAVTKSAVTGLTRALAVEWAGDNILVNSVSPGWIKTDMVESVLDEEREKKIKNRMPLHKLGSTEDIADMVWYLVSPASEYITGQDFAVDGGALAYGY